MTTAIPRRGAAVLGKRANRGQRILMFAASIYRNRNNGKAMDLADLTDLLSDLMHFVGSERFGDALSQAWAHYESESETTHAAPMTCPKCGSDNLDGGSWDTDGVVVWQRVSCECGNRWCDFYRYDSSSKPG